jgi:hypothetical protein
MPIPAPAPAESRLELGADEEFGTFKTTVGEPPNEEELVVEIEDVVDDIVVDNGELENELDDELDDKLDFDELICEVWLPWIMLHLTSATD